MTEEDIKRIQEKVLAILNEEFLASKDYIPRRRDWLSSHWTGFKSPEQLSRVRNTGYASNLIVPDFVGCFVFCIFISKFLLCNAE